MWLALLKAEIFSRSSWLLFSPLQEKDRCALLRSDHWAASGIGFILHRRCISMWWQIVKFIRWLLLQNGILQGHMECLWKFQMLISLNRRQIKKLNTPLFTHSYDFPQWHLLSMYSKKAFGINIYIICQENNNAREKKWHAMKVVLYFQWVRCFFGAQKLWKTLQTSKTCIA